MGSRALRLRFAILACATALLDSACGGGVAFVSFKSGGGGDEPPHVSLTSSTSVGRAGDPVRLTAAASDDFGVDRVELFHAESGGSATRLATDRSAPYAFDVVLADSGAGQARYFARAVDDVGQSTDSETLAITLRP
jgi:hypothetical protein